MGFLPKNVDWWQAINSGVIWLIVGFISVLVVQTSYDYSKSPATFSLFGQNQLFLLGFITVLLLFKYISKLKIGNILDVEFKDLETHVKNTFDNTDTIMNNLTGGKTLTSANVTDVNGVKEIRDELLKAMGNIETIKRKALHI